MKAILLTTALVVSLAGCNTLQNMTADGGGSQPVPTPDVSSEGTSEDKAEPMQVSLTEPAAPEEEKPESTELLFFDSYSFDLDLSSALREGYKSVDVKANFPLEDIPERMDSWFQRVYESKGSVRAVPVQNDQQVASRGVLGILLDVFTVAADYSAKEAMYSPADVHNVVMHYDPDTSLVSKVTFEPREE